SNCGHQDFLPAADIDAIFAAPYFLRPMAAANAPGLFTPGFFDNCAFNAAKRSPEPSAGFGIANPFESMIRRGKPYISGIIHGVSSGFIGPQSCAKEFH